MGGAVKRVLLGVVLLLGLVFTSSSVHAQETVTIEGVVENGTPQAEVPRDLAITLEVFSLGERLETRETVADVQGLFRFPGVVGGQGYGYIIRAQYEGGLYSYERDYPLPSEPVKLVVYESTSSMEAIKVIGDILFVNSAESNSRSVNFLELVSLENTGARTFVPDLTQVGSMNFLRFSLPLAARELDVQSSLRGGQVIQVDRGFAMTTPVPPGSHEVAYTFVASYEGGEITITHSFPLGADTFQVLVPQELGQARGAGLQDMGTLTLGANLYQRLEATDLDAGTTMTLELSGLPQPSLWQRWRKAVSGRDFVRGAIPVAFGMALLTLMAYALLRRREPLRGSPGVPEGWHQRGALIEAIARLDDQFQQSELEEEEYLQRRHELNRDLLRWASHSISPGGQPTPGESAPPSNPTPDKEEED